MRKNTLTDGAQAAPGPRAQGRLYGVGLGPGDPELMTLKAARLIAAAPVVAYPALADGSSLARSIAAEVIALDATEISIEVPMSVARDPAQVAYDGGAGRIADALTRGHDVAYLCEGDPFFYGSFMYLFARLSQRFDTVVVPGVVSFSAGAALAGLPLAARNEVLTILPAPLPDADLRARLLASDGVVIMKLGRHFARVRALINSLGLADRAVYVERATMAGGRTLPLSEAPEQAPYFSMILISKGADPWL